MSITSVRTVSKFLQSTLADMPVDPDLDLIRGDRDGSEANIAQIVDSQDSFVMILSDGSKFVIKVAQKL